MPSQSPTINKSHLTAIARKSLPAPVKCLIKHNPLLNKKRQKVLDFGCGKCKSINPSHWDSYDPHYNPDGIKKHKKYDTIFCTYVLCVVPKDDRYAILRRIQSLLSRSGKAYISVRNDRPKQGWGFSKRNTYQGRANNLPLEMLWGNSLFRIYVLTRDSDLSKVLP